MIFPLISHDGPWLSACNGTWNSMDCRLTTTNVVPLATTQNWIWIIFKQIQYYCRTSTASSRSQWALPDLTVVTAGPQPQAPDLSGHCRRSQWSLPDLNRKLQISVGTAGPNSDHCRASTLQMDTAAPQPQAPDLSGHCRASQWSLPDINLPDGHCRTSTASSRSQWALPDLTVVTAGHQPSRWTLPDLNHKLQISVGTARDHSGHCRTSTASPRSQCALPDLTVVTAGHQPSRWTLPDFNRKL